MPLDGYEGTLYKLRAAPPNNAVLKLYGGYLRARLIGEYIDGSVGDIWETQEMGLGN